MPRLKAPQRREQILSVATKLFAAHGYEGTTTAAIAEAAGVTEPILYRHFSGKAELFIAIVRAMSQMTIGHWRTIIAGIENPVEQIRAIARQFPEQIEHLSEAYHVLHGALATNRDPDVLHVVREHYKAKQAFFASIIRQGQATGSVRTDLDADLPAWEIINLGIGYGMIWLNLPGLYGNGNPEAMIDLILDCLKINGKRPETE
jgi:AcrR family transcriptional regulator